MLAPRPSLSKMAVKKVNKISWNAIRLHFERNLYSNFYSRCGAAGAILARTLGSESSISVILTLQNKKRISIFGEGLWLLAAGAVIDV